MTERRRRARMTGPMAVLSTAALLVACGPTSGGTATVATLATSATGAAGDQPAESSARFGPSQTAGARTAVTHRSSTAPTTRPPAGSIGVPEPPVTTKPTTTAGPGPASPAARPPTRFTLAFAGDVNFADRTAARLAADPATAFGVAARVLRRADRTMVNLETAITAGGERQDKSFTFRAPASALTALRAAGIDVATMANNHGADFGAGGLRDSLAAIGASHFPVIGIGADAAAAYTPYRTTVAGVQVSILAATAVPDETLQNWTAGEHSAGVASAFSDRLVAAVHAARTAGDVVVVYLHWGTEYTTCPDGDQQLLADRLAAAGASAVVGTHAHVLQGAGWRKDGVYVAYGLSNYLWWRSFGNEQDDNGVLTLTFDRSRVVAADFAPAHLDSTGVPAPATGEQLRRIRAEWERDRQCAGLARRPGG